MQSTWNEDILKTYSLDFYLKKVVFSSNAEILSVSHYLKTLMKESELSQTLNLQLNLHSNLTHICCKTGSK